jgi:hypothetical protein
MTADDVRATRPPVVLVPNDTVCLHTTRAIARVAGRHVTDTWRVPRAPWDLAPHGVVVSGSLAQAHEDCLVDAVVRGAGAIVALPTGASAPTRLVDALQRITPVVDGTNCRTLELDVVQLQLLLELSRGANTAEAARSVHLSVRTAHRRIAEARETLGATSTNAAAVLVTEAVRFWAA